MSLDFGPMSAGKRRLRTSTIAVVSSIDSVVWVVRATFEGSGTSTVSASLDVLDQDHRVRAPRRACR